MEIIYLDSLFLVNATVDYFLFLAAARVAGAPLTRLRFALAAVTGGGYAVLIFIFPVLQHSIYKIPVGLIMIQIAFYKSHHFIRQTFIFISLSFAFAGGIFALSLMGGQEIMVHDSIFYSSMDLKKVLLSSGVCYALLSTVFQNFGQHSSLSGELVQIKLVFYDKVISLTALVDTGNTLQDTISGQSVLVTDGRILSPFFQNEIKSKDLFDPSLFLQSHTAFANRLRLLPYQAVGVQGLLVVLRVDEIIVNGQKSSDTLVALSPTAVSDGGSYQALIGASNKKQWSEKNEKNKFSVKS